MKTKNYEIIYKKLKRYLQSDRKIMKENFNKLNYNYHDDLVDKLEYRFYLSLMNFLLDEVLPELEGKRWRSGFFNKTEY